jgi:hypothetical protein
LLISPLLKSSKNRVPFDVGTVPAKHPIAKPKNKTPVKMVAALM